MLSFSFALTRELDEYPGPGSSATMYSAISELNGFYSLPGTVWRRRGEVHGAFQFVAAAAS